MTTDCLFCKMASGEMDVPKLHDDDLVFAIRDINPRAPVHCMVIPKRHIPRASEITEADGALLARMFTVATSVAEKEGVLERGYRLVFNNGDNAGMTVPHLHLHVLGGRRLGPEG
jgi:histidine triad (HIT) family protein